MMLPKHQLLSRSPSVGFKSSLEAMVMLAAVATAVAIKTGILPIEWALPVARNCRGMPAFQVRTSHISD